MLYIRTIEAPSSNQLAFVLACGMIGRKEGTKEGRKEGRKEGAESNGRYDSGNDVIILAGISVPSCSCSW